MIRPPAGSVGWLLAHELRLGWRGVWGAQKGKRRRVLFAVLAVVVVVAAFSVGLPFAAAISRMGVEPSPLLYAGIDLALAVTASLMVAQGLNHATLTLYERRDLDLLLSSPLPARRVLTVRALAIAVSAVALFLALVSPFAISMAVFGDPRWLGAFPVLIALALGCTALGVALALALFAVIGPRTTRVIAQILAGVIGAMFFLLSQVGNLGGRGRGRLWLERIEAAAESGWFAHGGPGSWPARALLGEALPLLVFVSLGVGIFLLVTSVMGRRFGADAAAAAGVSTGRKRRARTDSALVGFDRGVRGVLVRKELRLLARDPWLISQVLLQLLYLIPLVFIIWRQASDASGIMAVAGASGVVFLTAQLVGNLAWITVSAEDAPDLIAASPVGKAQADRAKAIAAVLPVLPIMALPIAGLIWISPWTGLVTAAGAVAAGGSSALINIWHQKPGRRQDFRKSRRSSWLVSLAETLVAGSWAGAAALLALWQPFWIGPAALAAGVVVLLRRPAARA